jgi:hypothetical protein
MRVLFAVLHSLTETFFYIEVQKLLVVEYFAMSAYIPPIAHLLPDVL